MNIARPLHFHLFHKNAGIQAGILFLVIAASVLFFTGISSARADSETQYIRLLWTNDTHGFFVPVWHAEFEELDSYEGTAATEGKVGGYANIKALADKLMGPYPNSLFVDSGDTFDGSPVAQKTQGLDVIPVINAMGFDAMTPGNRDFAFGKTKFLEAAAAITAPYLSMNLRDEETGELVLDPYLIKDLPGGMRVAIVGVTHPLSTTGFVHGENLAPRSSYEAFQVADELSRLVARIRAEHHPDLVVAISHFGYLQDMKLASEQRGLDVILGAHTHHNLSEEHLVKDRDGKKDVIVVQAGSHGKFLGRLDLAVETGDGNNRPGKIRVSDYEMIRVLADDIVPDATVQALADAAYAPFAAELDRVIGTTDVVIARRGDVQSTMANLLTDAWAAVYGTDLSRHFGIRYGSSIVPGPITVGDVWNMVSPNIGGNRMYVGTTSGSFVYGQINRGLNREYGDDPYDWAGGDVTRFNNNVTYTYKVNAPDNQHLVDLKVGEDYLVQKGMPTANLTKTYTYAASAPAGSGTPPVPETTAVEEIIKYIEAQGTVSSGIDGRTQRLD
jgi:2',3'-cyclic-nucleotide 2'-phosphodiesterase (5'-nucleotidase family)